MNQMIRALSLLLLVSILLPMQVTAQQRSTTHRKIVTKLPEPKAIKEALLAKTRSEKGVPGPNYWQLEADYDIDVRLEPEKGLLLGSETITIHNNSPNPLKKIVLRLDHNIFRKNSPRNFSIPAEFTSGMVVEKLSINGREISLKRKNGADYATNLRSTSATIHLAKPIPAKRKSYLTVQWQTKLPGGNRGAGHRMTQRWGKRLFQPTQWFPRVAKYDDLRGWDENLYRGPAEFFNNFGKYTVSIDVPAGWIVSATGTLSNPNEVLLPKIVDRLKTVKDNDSETVIIGNAEQGAGNGVKGGDRLVWKFTAQKVNDFAWSTAKNYLWHATRAKIPGKGFIPIHMYFVPEREHLFENAGAISRHALEFYSKLWAPYPFPKLALQDGPSAGMEYPMVINSNQGAADHEVAHQWWPMMLGTNETDFGWMDEGLNVYMNALSDADRAGRTANFNGRGQSYRGAPAGSPTLMTSSNHSGQMYGFLAYRKTTLMLSMLGGIVGDEQVQKAIRKYTEQWKFKHPSPWDFANSMNESLEQDLDWFWYYWLFTNATVDGSITNARMDGQTLVVSVRQSGEMPAPTILKIRFFAEGELPKELTESLQKDGSVLIKQSIKPWLDGKKRREVRINVGTKKVKSVKLDPFGRFPDKNTSDNHWPRVR